MEDDWPNLKAHLRRTKMYRNMAKNEDPLETITERTVLKERNLSRRKLIDTEDSCGGFMVTYADFFSIKKKRLTLRNDFDL